VTFSAGKMAFLGIGSLANRLALLVKRDGAALRAQVIVTLILAGTVLAFAPVPLPDMGEAIFTMPKLAIILIATVLIAIDFFFTPPNPNRFDGIAVAYLLANGLSWYLNHVVWSLGMDWLLVEGTFFLWAVWIGETWATSRISRQVWERGAFAAAAATILVFAEGLGVHLPWSPPLRPVATVGHRNFVALVLLLLLPLLVRAWFKAGQWWREGVVTAALLALILTRARVSWVAGTGAGLAALSFVIADQIRGLTSGNREHVVKMVARLLRPLVIAALLATVVPWPGFQWRDNHPLLSSVGRSLDIGHGTGAARVEEYQATVKLIAEVPWLGLGPNQWAVHLQKLEAENAIRFSNLGAGQLYPHSQYLRAWSESGWLGLGLWVCIGLASVWGVAIAWRRAANRETTGDAVMTVTALIAFAIASFGEAPLSHYAVIGLAAFWFGVARSRWQPGPYKAPRRWLTCGFRLALYLLCATLLAGGLVKEAAYLPLWKGLSIAKLRRTEALYPNIWMPALIVENVQISPNTCSTLADEVSRYREIAPYDQRVLNFETRCAMFKAIPIAPR